VTATFVAVPEIAKGKGAQAVGSAPSAVDFIPKTVTHFFIKPLVAALICIGFSFATYAAPTTPNLTAPATTQLPTGARVSAGTASVSQSGAVMTVKQDSASAVVNWQTFNVGAQASVNFEQPNSQSVTLNRVLDTNPSQIFGKINANGSVFLQNPNGVYFAPGSSVDVGALVATTHSISDADFMSGNYSFSRTGSTGKILNQGTLTSKLGGYISLLAPEVQNQGVVVAKGGTIVLAAGETFQLQFEANNALTNILVSPSTIASYVENGNAVLAPGGLVILSAQAANAIQGGVVKNTGSIQADGLVNDGGVIRLVASDRITNTGNITADALPGGTGSGGQILIIADLAIVTSLAQIDGTLSAKGGDLGGNGGFIETSGSHVQIAETTAIATNAPKGTGGSWLIDPTDFSVGGTGSDMSGATLGTNLNSSSVTIMSSSGATGTSGDINIFDSVSWSNANKLTLSAANNVNIHNAINVPTGGSMALVFGTSVASGDYNFGSFSANNTQFTGSINFAGTGAGLFTTQLGGNAVDSYTVITNPSTYVAGSNPTGGITSTSGKFALGQNYNFDRFFTASPITGSFTGKFEGLGHTVGNLTNNGTGAIGLFSNSSGLIRDVGVNMSTNSAANGTGGLVNTNSGVIKNSFANASIYSAVSGGGAALYGTMGGLVGTNSGLITNSFATGAVSGTTLIGGLIGSNGSSNSASPSNILNSFSQASVTGTSSYVGGLIGQNSTTGTGASSTVTNSFATGDVWTSGAISAGGLIGFNNAAGLNSSNMVTDSYATGNVTGPQSYGANYYFGGLIGSNTVGQSGANASVIGSYATGSVSAAASWVGGLVGFNQINAANGIANISNSYATGAVSNPAAASGNAPAGIGGLVGLNRSSSANSSATVTSSYATGNVTGVTLAGTTSAGGLIGWNLANASGVNNSVTNSYATGVVSGMVNVGGLIGQNSAATGGNTNIDSSYASGNVSSSTGTAGGLVGLNKADTNAVASTSNISNSFSSGHIMFTTGSSVGGLVGSNTSVTSANSAFISNSYATGNVSSAGDSVGGLVGSNVGNGDSRILQSYATGIVESTSALGTNVGGLVGLNTPSATNSNVSISQSYATGAVTAPKTAGGLVGIIGAGSGAANIDQSYATGNVQQTATSNLAGGLVGQVALPSGNGYTQISNSFATGNVTGATSSNLGGLVGNFAAAAKGGIQNSYALGVVSGSANVGGLIGSLTAGSSLQNNYWNSTNNAGLHTVNGSVSGKSAATAGIASLSTTEMQTLSNFSGWDTNSVWQSLTYFNNQLPFLRQNNTLASIALVTGSNMYGDTPTLSYAITNSFGGAITSPTATGTPVWTLSQNGNVIGNQSISSTTNAGIYSLTYNSGISLGNYTIMSGSPTNWTVTKAPLGISVTGTYSGTASIAPTSYAVTGLKNNETMVPTAVTLSNANVAAANKYVTAITANTGNANFNNYDVASSFNATPNSTTTNSALLNPIALSVSAVASLTGNPYKGSAYTGTYTSSAMVPADANLISVTGVATGTDAGTYTSNLVVSLSGSAQTNYSTPAVTNANLVISPKAITITNTALTTDYDAVTSYAALAGQINYANTALVGNDTFGGVTQTANKTGIAQAGSYTVTPSGASITSGNHNNYQFSYVSSNNTVRPLSLTVANTSVASKVYDGTVTASVTNGTLQGVVAADALNVGLNQAGNFVSVNVGSNLAVTISDVLTGSAASNYTLSQPIGLTASITPKTLGISGQLAAHKVYDATTAASLTGGTLTGVVGSDAISLVQAGSFASAHVGPSIAITAANSLTGIGASNYQINQPTNLSANITPAILTVEGLAASPKVYDGTTSVSLSGIAVARPLGGGQVTINGSPVGEFADKRVGSNKYIDVTGFTLSGADASNYQVTGLHGVYGDITPASLSVSGLTAVNKVYDATTAATFTGATFAGLVNGDVVQVSTGVFNSKNVGTNKSVTALSTGVDAGNYVVTGLTGYTADITPAPLTVVGQAAANKVYDATTSAVLRGGVLNGVLAGEAVTLSQSGSFADKNVGVAKSVLASNTLAGSDASNYLVTQPINLTADITPAPLTVVGQSAANKVYDASISAVLSGGILNGVLVGDAVTINQAGNFADKNVGAAKAVLASNTLAGNDASNYLVTQPVNLTADITPASLNVLDQTAAHKVYDATTTAVLSGGVLNGVLAGDAVTINQTGSFADKNVGAAKSVLATNTLAGNDASNYLVTQPVNLTADITPAPLTVVGQAAANKVYDATTSAVLRGGVLNGVLAGEAVTLSQSGSFADKNVGVAKSVLASNTLAGSDASNYLVTQPINLTADITPATLLVSGLSAAHKTYDATTNAVVIGIPVVTALANDVVTLNGSAAGHFNDKNVGVGKSVLLAGLSINNAVADGSNYIMPTDIGLTADITKKDLSVAGTTVLNKVYDTSTTATLSGGVLVGVQAGDVLSLTESGSFSDKKAGVGKSVTANDSIFGSSASNYNLIQPTGLTGTITQASLSVTGLTVSNKTYDGTTNATLTGVAVAQPLAGDSVAVSGLPSAQFSTKNAGPNLPVNVANLTLSGPDANNYTPSGMTGLSATISPAPLTASAQPFTKVYDATRHATPSLTIASGLIGNETLVVTGVGALNNKNVSEANTLTVTSVSLSNGTQGGLASNYVLSPGQTALARVTPALISATDIAPSSSIYGLQIAPGTALLSGVLGGDVVKADVGLESVTRSSSGNVNAGAYKQTLTNLSGQDASNYTWAPFSTPVANYVVTPLVLSGSIASASINAGAVLTPGVATLSNVIPIDIVSVSEVIVEIPGAAPRSKIGNVVGTFVGSQKIASLSGADAANYDFSKVVGDYSIKTGFSSGTILPREMISSNVKVNQLIQASPDLSVSVQENKVESSRVAVQARRGNAEPIKNEQGPVEINLIASDPPAQKAVVAITANKNLYSTPTITSFDKSAQSQNMPSTASSFLGETISFPGMSNVYSGESTEIPSGITGTDQVDVMAPIYASIRELLSNPATYQVIGAASSIVLMVKTLVTPAMTTALNSLPGHSPSRAPVRVPTQSSSFLNNASNTRFARRA